MKQWTKLYKNKAEIKRNNTASKQWHLELDPFYNLKLTNFNIVNNGKSLRIWGHADIFWLKDSVIE
jgi:hypothetical protein